MHTSMPGTNLRPPARVSFRKSIASSSSAKSSVPPKVQPRPSTAKRLPIVGISA